MSGPGSTNGTQSVNIRDFSLFQSTFQTWVNLEDTLFELGVKRHTQTEWKISWVRRCFTIFSSEPAQTS